MKERDRYKSRRSKRGIYLVLLAITGTGVAIGAVHVAGRLKERLTWKSPEELLVQYMEYIPKQEYEKMYAMLNTETTENISREDFVKRNSAIYEGIEAENIEVEILEYHKKQKTVVYQMSFDTMAGAICFQNEAFFSRGNGGYKLIWNDSLIFPELNSTDKVRVLVTPAQRGKILDRNGCVLAGNGAASSVGIVPGKLENRSEAAEQIARLLEVSPEQIHRALAAQWVKEESFVPIKTVPKVEKLALMNVSPDEELLKEKERQEQLLSIPGVMISDIEVRNYPLGKAAAHLVGYVQGVTAEDLAKHPGEGYTSASVIGRSGMEGLFEKELKGCNGCRIYIEDAEGTEKKQLACRTVQDGQDIQLTIDADLQTMLYERFAEDKSCSAAMNPYTGEVLALVSTPSYDSNDFIRGLSDEQWTILNEDEKKPMYNRFRQVWCPGSVLKPITAVIGLDLGAVLPEENYGYEGLSWQKDSTWGEYYVTTLQEYEPVILENALVYSDNIYFAKAALRIGSEGLERALKNLGFRQNLPFEIVMAQSQYSNTEHLETEIQLADSGYGQGQILVNPLHLACLYSAFCNEGNVIKPCLVYGKDTAEYWLPQAFSKEAVNHVLEGMKRVVNDPAGTGYAARREDVLLAGKTGTAEIKASREDTTGTELGWFAVFTPDRAVERPILLISMAEDVKERGGSGYVVEKDGQVLEKWFGGN